MTTNDAAERLRAYLRKWNAINASADLDAALAAERRATVERIRAAFRERYRKQDWIEDTLDAEAER